MSLPSFERDQAAARWRRAAWVVGGGVVALNVAALAVRGWFVAVSGPYAATTGFEEFCLYNIWKVAHGFPAYEWPQRENYLLSFYNLGFYHVYAWWTKLWRADGAAIVAHSRWLSAIFAVFGMWVQAHLLRRMVPGLGRAGVAAAWGLALLVWLGTGFNAWTPLSARPDIPAVAFALAGFAAALRARESERGDWWWLGSSLLFFAAWSFKQSTVWILTGTVLLAWWTRAGWGALARVAGPFAALAGLVMVSGSEAYRYNLSEVPRILAWLPSQSLKLLAQAVVPNAFFFVFAAWAWCELARARRSMVPPRQPERGEARWWAAGVVALPPMVAGSIQLAIHGSSTNNILEGFVMVALLGGAAWLRRIHGEAPAGRALFVGTLALAAMIPLPLIQLGFAARGVSYVEVQGSSLGNLTKGNAAQLDQRRRFAAWLATLPKPLWTRDAMLQMPWFATDGRYPAFVLNHQFESDARAKGVLEGAGFAEWIKRRHFAALLLDADDPLAVFARAAGYVEGPVPSGFDPLATEFGGYWRAPRLFTRAAAAQ